MNNTEHINPNEKRCGYQDRKTYIQECIDIIVQQKKKNLN